MYQGLASSGAGSTALSSGRLSIASAPRIDMLINPTRINKEDLHRIRHNVAGSHGIDLYRQYKERAAASLLVSPDERQERSSDVSTLKRKRRAGKIPYVPLGDGSVAYLGIMLCDYIAFGERSVLLWGGGDPGIISPDPEGGPAPPSRNGGGRDVMEVTGGTDGPVHEA